MRRKCEKMSKIILRGIIRIIYNILYSICRYDPERQKNNMTDCHYNQNKLYVVYSALGSFFIPMAIMLYVYLKIFYVLTSRQHRMTKTEVISIKSQQYLSS